MGRRIESRLWVDSGEEARAEINADLLLEVYASVNLTFIWYGIVYLLFGASSILAPPENETEAILPFLSAMTGILLAYATILKISVLRDYRKRRRVLLVLLAVELLGAAMIGASIAIPAVHVPLLLLASLILGYALGLSALLAIDFAAGFERGAFVVCMCASMMLGFLTHCFCLMGGPVCELVAFLLLAVLGTAAALAYSRSLLEVDNPEQMLTADAFARLMLNSKTGWFLLLYGAVVGLKGAEMLTVGPSYAPLCIILSAAGFVGGVVFAMVILVKNQGNMLFGRSQRMVFPLLVLGLMPWGLVDERLVALSYLFVFAGCAMFLPFVFDTHHFLSKKYAVPPVYPLVIGSRSFVKGLLAGSVVAALISIRGVPDIGMGVDLALIVLLCFLLVLVQQEPDRVTAEPHAEPLAENASELGGKEEMDAERTEKKQERKRGRWKETCLSLAEAHSLTRRETEILALLLKANTTERISSILCISSHTTKTHIYHIYQKLGIGSRTELSELFEEKFDEARRGDAG